MKKTVSTTVNLRNFSNTQKVFSTLLFINLTACTTPTHTPLPKPTTNKQAIILTPNYICQRPQSYAGTVVGDGECVSFIKLCSKAPNTSSWLAGEKVLSLPSGSIPSGTIIATFKNGKYPSKTGYHAAIYISHNENGIWVWDQWAGKAVHQRLIRIRYDNAVPSNTAQAYRIVR